MSSLLQTERNLAYAFQVLARCPKTSDETAKQRIADTLIYQHGSLRVWFYTDPDSREILRRDRREWSAERIVDIFSDSAPPGVPVAMYVHYAAGRSLENHQPSTQAHESSDQGTEISAIDRVIDLATRYCHQYGDDAEPLSVDYFDADTLRAFLATRENKHNVILQKFVRGRADHASMVQVVWSPHNVLAMQRQNKHSLMDMRVPLYQRTNTFDNTTHLSHEVRLTAIMSARLDAECKNVVGHIFSVEQRVVTRMVSFFAFDAQRVPVLLFVSELQLTTQPATHEAVRLALTHLVKRKLCMVTPQIIPSDVVFPDYAKLSGGGGSGAGGSGGGSTGSSSGVGVGANVMSLHSSSNSTHIRHALNAAKAHTFDQQMRVMEVTFDSAYEARRDRGLLTDAQRHAIGGMQVFSSHAVGADTWSQFQSEFAKKRQTSLLRVGKTFYTAEPLVNDPRYKRLFTSTPGGADESGRQSSSVTRPASAAAGSLSQYRSASSTSISRLRGCADSSLSLRHRGYFVSRPGSSLTLHGQAAFTRGGGGGLYLMRQTAGNQHYSSSGPDGALGPLDLVGGSFDGHSLAGGGPDGNVSFEDTIAALRSVAHTPTKSGSSKSSSPHLASSKTHSLLSTMTLSDTMVSLPHQDFDVPLSAEVVPWERWKTLLAASASYRRKFRETQGNSRSLAQGGPYLEANPHSIQDNGDGTDVELLNLTSCDPDHVLRLDVARDRRAAGGGGLRKVNLWLLLRPSLSYRWAYLGSDMHRRSADGIDEVRSELDTSYLAIQSQLGGAPRCDVPLTFAVDLRRCPRLQDVQTLIQTNFPARKGGSVLDVIHDEGLIEIPWEISAWLLRALLSRPATSQDVKDAALANDSVFHSMVVRHAPDFFSVSDVCPPIATVSTCAEALIQVLANFADGNTQSSDDGGFCVTCEPRGISHSTEAAALPQIAKLKVHINLMSVTSERMGKIRAAIRSLTATLMASWNFSTLMLLRVVKHHCQRTHVSRGAVANRPAGVRSKVPAAMEVILPRTIFANSEDDADSDEAAAIRVVGEEEWRVITDTVVEATQLFEKHVRTCSFEWPPRLAFVS